MRSGTSQHAIPARVNGFKSSNCLPKAAVPVAPARPNGLGGWIPNACAVQCTYCNWKKPVLFVMKRYCVLDAVVVLNSPAAQFSQVPLRAGVN